MASVEYVKVLGFVEGDPCIDDDVVLFVTYDPVVEVQIPPLTHLTDVVPDTAR
jgi:hypothetical protein